MPIQDFQVWVANYGYAAIYVLLMLGIVGLPVPDETLLTLTGYLVFEGSLKLVPSFLCAFAGTVSGITISYCIGRFGGVALVEKFGRRLHIRPETVERVHAWFKRWGHWSLTIGYFVPGIRHVIAIVAGSSRLELRIFALYAYGGALFWTALFIFAGYYLGEGWRVFPETMTNIALWFAGLLFAGVACWWLVRRRRRGRSG
ncbi:MAG TPA: DedA family protein [Bacteroidota bacterium]|nr:DedA family protein [Bacteroidota bacterium]